MGCPHLSTWLWSYPYFSLNSCCQGMRFPYCLHCYWMLLNCLDFITESSTLSVNTMDTDCPTSEYNAIGAPRIFTPAHHLCWFYIIVSGFVCNICLLCIYWHGNGMPWKYLLTSLGKGLDLEDTAGNQVQEKDPHIIDWLSSPRVYQLQSRWG